MRSHRKEHSTDHTTHTLYRIGVYIGDRAFTTIYVSATSPEEAERLAKEQLTVRGTSPKVRVNDLTSPEE